MKFAEWHDGEAPRLAALLSIFPISGVCPAGHACWRLETCSRHCDIYYWRAERPTEQLAVISLGCTITSVPDIIQSTQKFLRYFHFCQCFDRPYGILVWLKRYMAGVLRISCGWHYLMMFLIIIISYARPEKDHYNHTLAKLKTEESFFSEAGNLRVKLWS